MTSRPTDEPRTVTVGVVVGGVVGWDNGAIPTVVATSTCCWKTHTSPVIKLGWKPNLQYTATYIFLMIQLQLTKKRSFRLLVRLSPLKSPWLTEKIQTAEHLSCLSIYWSRSTSPKIKFLQCKSALFSIHSPSLYGQTVQGPMQTTVGTTLKSTHLPSRSTFPYSSGGGHVQLMGRYSWGTNQLTGTLPSTSSYHHQVNSSHCLLQLTGVPLLNGH